MTTTDASESAIPAVQKDGRSLEVAGFWRRLIAYLIDVLVLGVFGLAIGWVFIEEVLRLGGWARWLGFGIAMVYFGLTNSRLFDGKTFGKMVMGVRVVDLAGRRISPGRSFARYFILGLPYFLNGALLPAAMGGLGWQMLVALIVFGGLFAIGYLYLFNRRTRQSLHDLVVRTLVVRDEPEEGRPQVRPIWRGHAVPVALVAALAICSPFLFRHIATQPQFRSLTSLVAGLQAEAGVHQVQVIKRTVLATGQPERRELVVIVHVRNRDDINEDFAKRIHARLLELQPETERLPRNVVQLAWGFDLGIAGWTQSRSYDFPGRTDAQGATP